MSLARSNLLILPLEHSEAFSSLGMKLAKRIGASELIYAAVALFSFDDSSVAEAIIDSNGFLEHDIINWLEDALTSLAHLFNHARNFHDGQELDEVVFDVEAEALYISSKARAVLYSRRRSTGVLRVLRGDTGPSVREHRDTRDNPFYCAGDPT